MREPEFKGRSFNALHWILGVLIAVFFLELFIGRVFHRDILLPYLALSTFGAKLGMVWQILTYGLLHGSFWHLAGNCIVLFGVGRMIQQFIGPKNLLIAFVISVIVGGLAWLAIAIPTHSGLPLVGASAGVMGLIAILAYLIPNQRIQLLLYFIIPLTVTPKGILIFLLIFDGLGLLFNELNLLGYDGTMHIAHSAHLGGALGGYLFCLMFLRQGASRTSSDPSPKADILPPSWFTRKKAPQKESGNFSINFSSTAQLRKEVDRILDKINTQGFGSLSEEERKSLDKAKDLLNR